MGIYSCCEWPPGQGLLGLDEGLREHAASDLRSQEALPAVQWHVTTACPRGGVTAVALSAGASAFPASAGQNRGTLTYFWHPGRKLPYGDSRVVAQQGQLLQLHGMAWHGMANPPALVRYQVIMQEVLIAKLHFGRCQIAHCWVVAAQAPLPPSLNTLQRQVFWISKRGLMQ